MSWAIQYFLQNTIELAPAVRERVWTTWFKLLCTGSCLLLCTGYCRDLFYPLTHQEENNSSRTGKLQVHSTQPVS